MRNEFTAVVEHDGRWFIAYCPEIPGANGQGRKKSTALKSLTDAIELILEARCRLITFPLDESGHGRSRVGAKRST